MSAYYLLLTAYYVPSTTYYLLLTTYYLLPSLSDALECQIIVIPDKVPLHMLLKVIGEGRPQLSPADSSSLLIAM